MTARQRNADRQRMRGIAAGREWEGKFCFPALPLATPLTLRWMCECSIGWVPLIPCQSC